MVGRGEAGLLKLCVDEWQRFFKRSRVRTRKANTRTIQRVYRGFVGRERARRRRLEIYSAEMCQRLWRCNRARRLVRQKQRQHKALLEKLSRLFAGLRESHFLAWKKHVGVMNSVRSFMGGSDAKTKRRHFTRWKLRKHYATTCQRVFRGHKGRKRARKRMVKVMQRRLKEGAALAANAAREAARYDSEKLRFLKAELAALEEAKNSGAKEIDAHLHGPDHVQRFQIATHYTFLRNMLLKAIAAEVARLKDWEGEQRVLKRKQAENWRNILQGFMSTNPEELYEAESYDAAGKSFEIDITSEADALATLREWKQLHRVGFLPRGTFICWVANALLLRPGLLADQRTTCWNLCKTELPRGILTDLSAFIMKQLQAELGGEGGGGQFAGMSSAQLGDGGGGK